MKSNRNLVLAAFASVSIGVSAAWGGVSVEQGGVKLEFATLREAFESVVTNDAEATVTVGEGVESFDGRFAVSNKVSLSAGGRQIKLGKPVGFTVAGENASLELADVCFVGYENQQGFIRVEDGATVTLGSGLVLTNLVNNGEFGNVTVLDGTLKMKPGALITHCRSRLSTTVADQHVSGGIYLEGENAVFEMTGGEVVGGTTARDGGGVFIGSNATMRVSGDATVSGNRAGSLTFSPNDVFLFDNTSKLILDGALTGSVGVRYRSIDPEVDIHNTTGMVFAASSGSPSGAENFFNDTDPLLVGAASGSDLVWALRATEPEPIPEERSDEARVRLTDVATSNSWLYATVNDAFTAADAKNLGDVRFEMLDDDSLYEDAALKVATNVVFEGGGFTLDRLGDFALVADAQRMAVSNLVLSGESGGATPILKALSKSFVTLGDGATVRGVSGDGATAAGGVWVKSEATFAMEEGSMVVDCANLWTGDGKLSGKRGLGGGVLVEKRGKAIFRGGSVTGCSAQLGGGVFANNGAIVEVSGGFVATGNLDLDGNTSDFAVAKRESVEIVLAAPFEGDVGYTDGTDDLGQRFGRVDAAAWDWSDDPEELAKSAAKFVNERTTERGRAVTNGTECLLVWSNAIDENGQYFENKRDYGLVDPEENQKAAEPTLLFESVTYNRKPQTVATNGFGYVFSGETQTTAGVYVAVASLREGFEWEDGTTEPKTFDWEIERATYDVSNLRFGDAEVDADGKEHSIFVSAMSKAQNNELTVTYEGNGQSLPGSYTVTAKFAINGDLAYNYLPIDDLTATLTITGENPPPPPPPPPPPEPIPCVEFAFVAISNDVTGTKRELAIAPVVAGCTYDVFAGSDLADQENWTLVTTLKPDADGEWPFEVEASDDLRFWRAVGHDGVKVEE